MRSSSTPGRTATPRARSTDVIDVRIRRRGIGTWRLTRGRRDLNDAPSWPRRARAAHVVVNAPASAAAARVYRHRAPRRRVRRAATAVVVCGPSGAGKSTLIAAAVRAGAGTSPTSVSAIDRARARVAALPPPDRAAPEGRGGVGIDRLPEPARVRRGVAHRCQRSRHASPARRPSRPWSSSSSIATRPRSVPPSAAAAARGARPARRRSCSAPTGRELRGVPRLERWSVASRVAWSASPTRSRPSPPDASWSDDGLNRRSAPSPASISSTGRRRSDAVHVGTPIRGFLDWCVGHTGRGSGRAQRPSPLEGRRRIKTIRWPSSRPTMRRCARACTPRTTAIAAAVGALSARGRPPSAQGCGDGAPRLRRCATCGSSAMPTCSSPRPALRPGPRRAGADGLDRNSRRSARGGSAASARPWCSFTGSGGVETEIDLHLSLIGGYYGVHLAPRRGSGGSRRGVRDRRGNAAGAVGRVPAGARLLSRRARATIRPAGEPGRRRAVRRGSGRLGAVLAIADASGIAAVVAAASASSGRPGRPGRARHRGRGHRVGRRPEGDGSERELLASLRPRARSGWAVEGRADTPRADPSPTMAVPRRLGLAVGAPACGPGGSGVIAHTRWLAKAGGPTIREPAARRRRDSISAGSSEWWPTWRSGCSAAASTCSVAVVRAAR